CRFCCGEGADSGIHADDQAYTFAGRGLEDLALHSVAFPEAVRDVKTDPASEPLDCGFQQHYGDGPVHVVVAVDEDRLLSGDGALNSLDRGGHAEHEIRVVQVVKAGSEERGGIGGGADAPRSQKQRDEGWKRCLSGEGISSGGIRVPWNAPATYGCRIIDRER